MAGGTRSSARSRAKPSSSPVDSGADPLLRGARPGQRVRKGRSGDHGPIRLMDVSLRTLLASGLAFVALLGIFSAFHYYRGLLASGGGGGRELMRVVTPLAAPRMMDLPQFQGEHRESLYWGTYRPHVYLGIRARTPKSLIAGLMWIGIKDGQYHLRHVCQDSDDLKTYGWIDHNGRDYGRQVLVDHGLKLTTSFLKAKGHGSGYGGDWTVRVEAENEKSTLDEAEWMATNLFFYISDEEGNGLSIGQEDFIFMDKMVLTFGSRTDVGDWKLYLSSEDNLETHYTGIRTLHMHNLTELLLGDLSVHARRSGRLQLSDTSEQSPNIFFFQISAKLPFKMDVAFISGTHLKGSEVQERIESLTGTLLSSRLGEKQKEFEEKYTRSFYLAEEVESESTLVGKAAISNLLGGIGYFYGQSKIALPRGFILDNGNNFVLYWPSELFTAVPSRSFFPRGFLWDEGFHQLLLWRWDIGICLDILGHWLDLINEDGWIPREQILGAEALSKVPEEFVLQHPTNGNPPTLFLVIHDLVRGVKGNKFSITETKEISEFLSRAFVRLEAWIQWFNTTQSGKDPYTYYWHGRDNMTTRELNPKTLTSGLDDYPRASHPSDQEHHVDLRCWMLLAADCMHSIAVLLEMKDGKVYQKMLQQLSNFEILNQIHLDNVSGAYFDFGNHTEKLIVHEIQHRT
uniref:Mannosyl-oligosaccharide glucosidase n=1 Tax=Anthurium amnicola TaxID=1678845 RepID=A0A1D1XWE2_9ARAE